MQKATIESQNKESQNKLNLGGRQLSPATIESQIIQIL